MRCIQITEKLEMAKSASTRSLSAKRLGVVTSATKAVSSSPSLRAVAKASPRQSRIKLNSPTAKKGNKSTPSKDTGTRGLNSPAKPNTKAKNVTTKENKSPTLMKKVLVRNMKTPSQVKSTQETPKSVRKKGGVKEVNSPANTTKLSKSLSQIKITDPSPKRGQKMKAVTPRSTVKLSLAKSSPKARGKVGTPVAERVLKLKKSVKTPQLSSKKTIAKVTPKLTPKRKMVDVVQPTPRSGVKRKVAQQSEDVTPAKITKTAASPIPNNKKTRKTPAKTPAKTPKAVSNKKPQVTRSKQATVLRLKK